MTDRHMTRAATAKALSNQRENDNVNDISESPVFQAIKVLSDCLYQLQFKSKTQVLHNDRLKPYRSLEVPSWAKKLQRQLKHPEVTS